MPPILIVFTTPTPSLHDYVGGANPFDSYQYASQLAQDGSIDGTVLRVNKRNYLVYSCFSAVGQSLCIAPMNSPTSVGAFRVLSEPTQDWERIGGAVNEGPAPLYHNGRIFMAYSASFCWTDSYQLGLLTFNGGDPMDRNRWSKSAGPVFSSANNNWGPGHNR
jgi:GH43 family beta-xylosidase